MRTAARIALLVALAIAGGCDAKRAKLAKRAPTAEDAEAVARLVKASRDLDAQLELQRALFERADEQLYTAAERTRLLGLWAPLVDHDLAFASYWRRFLEDWRKVPGKDGPERALVLGMTAFAAQTRARLRVHELAAASAVARTALNEEAPEVGLAAGHFDAMLVGLAQPATMLRLEIGSERLQDSTDPLRKDAKPEDARYRELLDQAGTFVDEVERLYERQSARLMAEAARVTAANQLDQVVDPLVQNIAEWMGDTRLRGAGASLISAEQVDWLQTRLEPGDLIVERRNWYLSNLGLPGFWPHSELYVGTREELALYFDDDPGVRAVFPDGLSRHLEAAHPAAWAAWGSPAADGKPHRVFEAISEGVVFSSLHEAAKADYIGALRPRLSKADKARAIARGLAHFGKPYDFDFDFLTVSALVCTEVLYQAYLAPAGEGAGLTFPLTTVIGRLTLPPNDIVRMFDEQSGAAGQQLDFVAFLDGREGEGRAVEATEQELRASWRRPKWDLSQQ